MAEVFNFWKIAAGFAGTTFILFGLGVFLLRFFTKARYEWPAWTTPAVIVGALVLWLLFYGDGWTLLMSAFHSDDVPTPLFGLDVVSRDDQIGFLKVEFVSAVLGVVAGLVGNIWAKRRF